MSGPFNNAEALEKIRRRDAESRLPRRGFAFAVVPSRGDRNFDAHTVSIVFAIDEGRGLTSSASTYAAYPTRDYVLRREFDLSEGDGTPVRWLIVPSAG